MTNVRKKQIKTIGILLVAVIALAVGFSAFSSSLNIKTRLSVNPNNGTFLVKFSKSSSTLDESDVVPTKSSDIFAAYNGEIDNRGIPTISNLGGQFTQPGETITYDFYTLNTGSYNAYLTDVIFNNVEGTTTNKVCTSLDGTHQSEVDEACKGISIKVIMGIDTIINTRSVTGHTLEPNASEPVKVIIEYSSSATLPEVEFTVDFGTISMLYNSLEESDVAITPSEEDSDYPNVPLYLTDTNGKIYHYSGTDTNLVIPSSLPAYTIVENYTFYDSKCVVVMQSINAATEEAAQQACSEFKAQFENDTLSEIYEMIFKGYGVVLPEFTPIGENVTVTEIGEATFFLRGIESVTLPNTLITIDDVAFTLNSITSLTIPSSVETIGDSSFMYNLIATLDLSNATNLETIDKTAFASNELTSVSIPDSVTTIGTGAFAYNSLQTVEIGSGIESIGVSAFDIGTSTNNDHIYGPNNIQTVTFAISEPQQESQTYYNLVGNNQFHGYEGTFTWGS